MRKHVTVFAAIAAVLVSTAASAAEPLAFHDLGPLRIRDQFLLGMGFLAFDPESADVLDNGRWQLDLIETVTNTFAKSNVVTTSLEARRDRGPVTLDFLRAAAASQPDRGAFYLDGETYRTAVAIRRGVGHRLQLGVTIQALHFSGGFLDSTIEGFHRTFRLGQAGRLGTYRNRYGIYLRSGAQEVFVDRSSSLGLGDTVFSAKYALVAQPGRKYVAVEGLVKAPTGRTDDLSSSGSADLGIQVLFSRFYSKSCLHASAGVLHLGANARLRTPIQTRFSGMVAYEHGIINRRTSAILQVTASQTPFGDLHLAELAQVALQASLGIKCAFGSNKVLFVALTENLAHFNNTADVGFHVGWTQRI